MAELDKSLLLNSRRILSVDDIIIGCSGLAGIYNSLPEEEAIEVVKVSLDLGFRQFDVAPHYGLGLAEERLGKALKLHTYSYKNEVSNDYNQGVNIQDIKIWSKVGRVIVENDDFSNYGKNKEDCNIEYENMAGCETCIFPLTPFNRIPILDYTSNGVFKSYQDSVLRLNNNNNLSQSSSSCDSFSLKLYGLRLHDVESITRFNQSLGICNHQTINSGGRNDDISNIDSSSSDSNTAVADSGGNISNKTCDDSISSTNTHGCTSSHQGGLLKLINMRDKDHLIYDIGLGMNDPTYILKILKHYDSFQTNSSQCCNDNVIHGDDDGNDDGDGKLKKKKKKMKKDLSIGSITSIMMAGKWNLLNQSGYEVLIECQRRGIEVHNAGILCSGLLAGGDHLNYKKINLKSKDDNNSNNANESVKKSPNNSDDDDILLKLSEWKRIAYKYNVSLYEVAVCFACLPNVITKIAIGVSHTNEVHEIYNVIQNSKRKKNSTLDGGVTNSGVCKFPLPCGLWKEAVEAGLLSGACVPLLSN